MGANLQESRDLAQEQARLNQISQRTPFGSITFGSDPSGRTTATTQLSPAQQELLRRQQASQGVAGANVFQGMRDMPSGPVISGMPALGNISQNRLGADAPIGQGQWFRDLPQAGAGLPGAYRGISPNAFADQRGQVEQAQFQRAMALMNPEFARQEESMQQRLANQGLPQASRAYTAEATRFDDTRNRATEQAALAAVLAGGQEQSRMMSDFLSSDAQRFGQGLANQTTRFGQGMDRSAQGFDQALSARDQLAREQMFGAQQGLQNRELMGREALINRTVPFDQLMSQAAFAAPQMPNFFAPGQTQVQSMATPGQGGFFQQLAPSLISAGGTVGAAALLSDRRAKMDIRRVGHTDDGLPIYVFRYIADPEGPMQMGVMAQDVLEVKPEAVGKLPNGLLTVDYGRL